MDSTGYPDDHNFFELGYCGHTQLPHQKIFLDQTSDLILSQFQEEYRPFIKKALWDEHIHVVSLYYDYKPKTDTPRTKNTEEDENDFKIGPKYGGESTGLHRHMISVVVFSYSETLKCMLIVYAATEMGFLDDYSDADPNHKSIRGNGINTYLFHVAQCNIFNLTTQVKKILIANVSLKTFYSSFGFFVIKKFATSTNFEAACSQFHYETENLKQTRKNLLAYSVYKPSHGVLHFFMTIEWT